MSTLVCLIFSLIVFPLDILLHRDEQACQREGKNQMALAEKLCLFIVASPGLHYVWKFMRKYVPFKIQLFVSHSSWQSLSLVAEEGWLRLFTYFASWPWASYLNSVHLDGIYSVNFRGKALHSRGNWRVCTGKCTLPYIHTARCFQEMITINYDGEFAFAGIKL